MKHSQKIWAMALVLALAGGSAFARGGGSGGGGGGSGSSGGSSSGSSSRGSSGSDSSGGSRSHSGSESRGSSDSDSRGSRSSDASGGDRSRGSDDSSRSRSDDATETRIEHAAGHHEAGDDRRSRSPAEDLSAKPQLSERLAAALGVPVADLGAAAAGFKNFGQFVAAVQVSKNLGLAFADVKAAMLQEGATLGSAIKTLRPDLNSETEREKAERQTDDTLRSVP